MVQWDDSENISLPLSFKVIDHLRNHYRMSDLPGETNRVKSDDHGVKKNL